ncbi:MAG: serine/threonine protein kinase [Candidatus Sericytochromatia bacterium]|nr:serine/threonine protein kinase [Candidatus Sericytochromatia bacterium]
MNANSNAPSLPNYPIESLLGSGGFGSSYLARRESDGLACVVKVLAWDRLKDWKSLELFEREAKVLQGLSHPQIPQFLEYIQQDQTLCLVQSYVPGQSLEQWLKQKGNFTHSHVLDLALSLTEILVYLQKFSPPLIHRDIKPGNIIIDNRDQPHLIDFGAVRDTLNPATEAGGSTVVGTFGYMAPEQFQGKAYPASDIYSLGVTLIYALTRKAPEELESTGLQLNFRPWVKLPEAFADVLEKMIAPDWQHRYPDAKALQTDLLALKAGKPTSLQVQKNVWTEPLPAKYRTYLLLGGITFLLFAVLWQMFSPVSQKNREEIRKKIERTYEEQYRERYGPLPQKSPG